MFRRAPPWPLLVLVLLVFAGCSRCGEKSVGAKGSNPARFLPRGAPAALVVPLRMNGLSFFSTTSVLGTPRDVTLSELAIEAFLPADATTAAALHRV